MTILAGDDHRYIIKLEQTHGNVGKLETYQVDEKTFRMMELFMMGFGEGE